MYWLRSNTALTENSIKNGVYLSRDQSELIIESSVFKGWYTYIYNSATNWLGVHLWRGDQRKAY